MVSKDQLARSGDDAPFNMAQIFYIRLNELSGYKTRMRVGGDLAGWYQALEEIHTQISFKLTKKQNEDLEKQLKKIKKYLDSPMPPNRRIASQMQGMIEARVYGWLQAVDREVMRYMELHKMIFPRIETRTPMQQMRDSLGLGGGDS